MDRFQSANKASILGMIGNIILLLLKGSIGIITKSQAMIADATNSAGDIFSSLMTFIGNKIASVPSDEDHNLGHGKAEYIYSLLISLAMIVMGLTVALDSIQSLLTQETFTFSIWLIVICIITILIKFSLYMYTKTIAEKHNNLLMKANCKDHRNDCIVTSLNLLAIILGSFGIYWVDGIVGTVISIWIIATGIGIFKESYDVLMDKSINEETKQQVYELVKSHDTVKGIKNFHSAPVGYQYQIFFTIQVDGNLKTFESHKIANHLEKEITNIIPEVFLTVIHVDPIHIQKEKK
jgi:cation diffusion facilitator family transporter